MIMFLILSLFLFPLIVILLTIRRTSSQKLPPGSLGLPIIGHSLSLLWAMKANTAEEWIAKRAKRYGPVSKLSLFGTPTVFIYGQAANKFIFTDGTRLSNQQTDSMTQILGNRSLLELRGEDHKRVRGALTSFLKPDCLKNYVGKMEEEIKLHFEMHWQGNDEVTVLPLMKNLMFNMICSLIFGLESGPRRDVFITYFQQIVAGVWAVPINLPFTHFNRCLKASAEVRSLLKELISEKRMEVENGTSTHQDLITSLLGIGGADNNQDELSEDEMIHNVMLIMIAGYETSSTLITLIIRHLANDATVLADVLKEQEEIINKKPSNDLLNWEDISKMKYTWRVAMEILRTIPPMYGGFRKTLEDIEYEGYMIPKGWQIFWVTSMTHMDEEIFKDPSRFDPSRFENPSSIPPYSYIPFGGGPRVCPGYEFAKTETLLVIHYLVTHFTWKLCNDDGCLKRDPLPVPTRGLPIQIISKKRL